MHTYCLSDFGTWLVGYWTGDLWHTVRKLQAEAEAAAWASYLNGGERPQ